MRLVTITLAILLVLIQYPLWIGKGGYFRVRELTLQLDEVKAKNEENSLRNAKLASEVQDLEVGTAAIEERARYELGMIKKNEVFIQVIDTSKFLGKGKPVEGNLVLPVKEPQKSEMAMTSQISKEKAVKKESESPKKTSGQNQKNGKK